MGKFPLAVILMLAKSKLQARQPTSYHPWIAASTIQPEIVLGLPNREAVPSAKSKLIAVASATAVIVMWRACD